jgi:hypothetical protein
LIVGETRAARRRITSALVVPALTATVRPASSWYDATRDPAATISLVPARKNTGENATVLALSSLAVVEPHSRSTSPEITFGSRASGVNGT